MPFTSSTRGAKRKSTNSVTVFQPTHKSSKVTLLSPSLLLLEIPADINTSLPVWDAMRSQQLNIAWTVNPYSINMHLTPMTSQQAKTTTPTKDESLTRDAQTSTLPSSCTPQPQMVTQSISQLHGAPQSTSSIVLTFCQSSTQSPQKIPPNSTPATSLMVSLPLIITQPPPAAQPSTLPSKGAIQTPTTTPTKQQPPSKVPVPSPFHTKSSSNVQICDDFLLSECPAGKRCKMHHTPYPFHWQLWCIITHQWIDFQLRSQVILERLYSNVNQEVITIKDGNDSYALNFDSMEFDDQLKYDRVRRLTNTDSQIKNPYFPSKWKVYWWNHMGWEEYQESLSTLLLKKMSEKEYECSFHIGAQRYKVDFTSMTQTNVATGFVREVRCRPVYQSPESMQPHLRTGVHTEPPEPTGDPPAANFSVDPLEEFSSWYPPVWCLSSQQDYSLVDVPAGTKAYRTVQNLFYKSLPESQVDIICIQQVQNLLHWDKYQRHKAHMQKQHTKSKEPLERHLFHGTTKEAAEDICHNNFDPRVAGINGTSYGFGTYFATAASFSNTYSAKVGPDEVRHMFLAKVLVGKASVGKTSYRRPPPLNSKTKQYRLYDTCVDDIYKTTMFVVFDSCQCYPYYLIKYKELPREADI